MSEWRCKNGHVIGVVRHKRLVLVDPSTGIVLVIISGNADVRCSVCGVMRTWHFVPMLNVESVDVLSATGAQH